MTKLPLPGLVDLSFVTVQYPAQEARKTGLIDEVAVKVTKGKTPRSNRTDGAILGGANSSIYSASHSLREANILHIPSGIGHFAN